MLENLLVKNMAAPIDDNKPGVYLIVCNNTHKYYIGSSNSMRSRRYKHFGDLRKGIHRIEEMQNDFNKYGEESFSYYILVETNKDKNIQLMMENMYIEKYKDQLYNLSKSATRKGYKEKQEVKNKMSENRKGLKNSNSKYSLEDFKKVKKLLLAGFTTYKVSEITGISSSNIKNFRKGVHWANEELGCIFDWNKEENNA